MTTWYQFALIDCAGGPDRMATLHYHAAKDGLQHRSLFDRQPEAEHAAAAPWLLALPHGAVRPTLDPWLAQLGQSNTGLTRLASEVPFDALFDHLEAQLDIALPDGTLALMRFFDPRAWLRYAGVLTVDQQLQLLGPALEWQITLQGQEWTLARADLQRLKEDADRVTADA
ncbi:DUF4123 domain-containing protein [Xanthomonas translucens]|uniref:DUF4123 domain-containing protein n=1 Tax=Xanthomonas campestris pv. translucens TaxID=343 RepID=UPI001F38741F|nr:DUF4123 domain-containing protein [Xanthomonas translucens]UII65677.1 DUF4123 domain-containing protein [Xanthomonas translucens]